MRFEIDMELNKNNKIDLLVTDTSHCSTGVNIEANDFQEAFRRISELIIDTLKNSDDETEWKSFINTYKGDD